jgi:pyruvate formate lyase activating enzyme
MSSLAEILGRETREGELYERLPDGRLRCFACGHCCPLPDGAVGVCKVRFNQGGKLYVPWGYVGGVQCDPIEKKPFFHVYPGALAYSFGMLGCDLHCAYCQNWVTSQALRDPEAIAPPLHATPEDLVRDAVKRGAQVVVSTYNEPLITSEWAVEIFARQSGRVGHRITFERNGHAAGANICAWIDFGGSKSLTTTIELGGRIGPILDTIRQPHAMGIWLRSHAADSRLQRFTRRNDRLTRFVAEVSPDILVARHRIPRRLQDDRAAKHHRGNAASQRPPSAANGLRYIYAGNLPGQVGDLEHTVCASCGERLITRFGYHIRDYRITADDSCPSCGAHVPGRWRARFEGQLTSRPITIPFYR